MILLVDRTTWLHKSVQVFMFFCDCGKMVVVQEEAGVCGEDVVVCVCDIRTAVAA